jgi:hypothetical protein
MSEANGRNAAPGILGSQIGRPVPPDRPARRRAARHPIRTGGPLMADERDTVVVHDEGGSSMGAILGVIAIIVLLVAVWYFALGPGASSTGTNNGSDGSGSGGQTAPTLEVPNPASS